MPKIKPSEIERHNKIVYSNIRSRCAALGFETGKSCSKKIGMPASTFSDRKNEGNWGFDEIVRAAKALKVSVGWLVTDHSKPEEVIP